jgi:hypothetical protein
MSQQRVQQVGEKETSGGKIGLRQNWLPWRCKPSPFVVGDRQPVQHLEELADSGDVRGVANHPKLAEAYEEAQGTQQAVTDNYRNLKGRMNTQLGAAGATPAEGPGIIGVIKMSFGENPSIRKTSSRLTGHPLLVPPLKETSLRTGAPYTPHTQLHQVTYVPGLPRYRQMADWAKPTGVREMFNFWNSKTPLGDVDELLKNWTGEEVD